MRRLPMAGDGNGDFGPSTSGHDPDPDGLMLPFHEQIVDELLELDGLSVLAEGLGLSETLAGLIKNVPGAIDERNENSANIAFSNLLALPGGAGDTHGHDNSGHQSTSNQNETISKNKKTGATLLLGVSDSQKNALRVHLKQLAPGTPFPPEITADGYTAVERDTLYRNGGPLFVTTRIAAVDILRNSLPPGNIAGVIICNAHRVTDFSGEAFVVRLFRSGNRLGFVRGITDRPGDLVRGFNSVERAMKALMVRNINLWPRFHLGVRGCLDKHAPEVVELRQPLTPATKKIQDAIVEVMHACMGELKKSKHVDTSELTLEAGLHRSFDRVLQRQLDPVWHSVTRKLKQIVYDLRTLRNLATYLLRYDSVTFLRYLETLRVAEGRESVWLYTEAAHTIFEQAKKRVYLLRLNNNEKKQNADDDNLDEINEVSAPEPMRPDTELVTVLEPMPKWPLLEEVVEEVRVEKEALRKRMLAENGTGQQSIDLTKDDLAVDDQDEIVADFASQAGPADVSYRPTQEERFGQGPLLVVAKDDATANQLANLLCVGSQALMRGIWGEYLERQRLAGSGGATVRSRGGSGGKVGRGGGSNTVRTAKTAKPMSKMDRMRAAMMGDYPTSSGPGGGGRGRGRGGRARAPHNSTAGLAGSGSVAERAAVVAAANTLAREQANQQREVTAPLAAAAAAAGHKTATGDLDPAGPPADAKRRKVGEKGAKGHFGANADDEVLITGEKKTDSAFSRDPDLFLAEKGVYVTSLSDRGGVLAQVNPSFIVVYDPDAAFIREIEVHKASRPGAPMRVYFLVHDTSLEEQRYLSSVRYETEAFDQLVRGKQHMAIPKEQEGRVNDGRGVVPEEELGPNELGPGIRLPHGTHAEGLLTVDGFERPRTNTTTFANTVIDQSKQVLPLPQLEPRRPTNASEVNESLNTRRRGGQLAATTGSNSKLHLVVDMREFMSSLPSILHQSGFVLKPATIEVGDYVLSPHICVERKAIPDLIGSLQSGRLFNQATSMLKHYKIPILLIEFELEKAFALQSLGDLGGDISVTSTQSRLCLLVLAFPRLRILWSRSLHATAEMFRTLKIAEPEPTVVAAAAIGVPQSSRALALPPTEEPFNQPAIDVLQRLPGITESNYRKLLSAIECLADLTDLSKEDLTTILGDQRQAKTLHEFIHAPFPINA